MTELCIVTQTSDLLFRHLSESFLDPVIIVTDGEVGEKIHARTGMNFIHIPLITRCRNEKEKDQVFYRNTFTPLQQLQDMEIDGMPINKVLGLDRFRFWHYGDALTLFNNVVIDLDITSLSVTLDINSAIPYLVAAIFPKIPVTLIKTENIRTREYFMHLTEFGLLGNVKRVVISFDDEKEYISKLCPEAEIVAKVGRRMSLGSPQRDELRKSIRTQNHQLLGGELIGIIYDEKDNNAFVKLAKRMKNAGTWKGIFVFPMTTRSHELFYKCVPAPYTWGVNVIDDPAFVHAMDRIVTTRYYEYVHNRYGELPWTIFDPGFINYSDDLSLENIEGVTIFHQ